MRPRRLFLETDSTIVDGWSAIRKLSIGTHGRKWQSAAPNGDPYSAVRRGARRRHRRRRRAGRMRADAPDNGIFLLSEENGSQSLLVGGGAHFDPVWTPDGTRILFSSDRAGSGGLWSISVRDGKS